MRFILAPYQYRATPSPRRRAPAMVENRINSGVSNSQLQAGERLRRLLKAGLGLELPDHVVQSVLMQGGYRQEL